MGRGVVRRRLKKYNRIGDLVGVEGRKEIRA